VNKEAARGNRLARQLAVLRKARTQLTTRLEKEQQSAADAKRRCKQFEVRANRTATELDQAKAELEKQMAMHSSQDTVDAARVGRAFVNGFRGQIRPPTDTVVQSIRSLLETPLADEQKRLVESAHQNALIVQANLHEEAA
jgi:hypothetical protein